MKSTGNKKALTILADMGFFAMTSLNTKELNL
nr:MAG TPA: hypothetical protein [Caudoviricetes sp.]